MSEYEELLEELVKALRESGELSCSDLLSWGESKGVGPVTLLSLIDELSHRGLVEVSEEKELVDEHLELELPRRIRLRGPAARPPRPAARPPQRRRGGRAARGGRGGGVELLRFISGEEGEAAAKREGRGSAPPAPPERGAGSLEAPVAQRQADEAAGEASYDEWYASALQYLDRYWSVGQLRFEMDMRSMGVPDPASLLRRLQAEGLVEVVEPGVVNANREAVRKRLSELSSKVPPKGIADLFD